MHTGCDAPDTPRPSALMGARAMDVFLAILILVPTVAVLVIGALWVIGTVVGSVVAGVDGIVVALRHRYGASNRFYDTHYRTPAMHH